MKYLLENRAIKIEIFADCYMKFITHLNSECVLTVD